MNRLHISMPAARCLALIVITLAVSASDNPCVAQFGSSSRSPTGGGPSPGRPGGPSASRPGYRSPVFEKRADGEVIRGVKFVGLQAASESEIRPELQTRIGRQFSPKMLQDDVRKLSSSGRFRNVRTYRKSVAGGVEVTFEVDELPTVGYIRFEGNKQVRDKKLRKRVDLKPGQPLHPYAIEESRRALQEYYLEQGFADAQVDIAEGTKPGDKGVVFSIYEGPQQRIIESKPGLAWIFKGKVDKNQIEADREKLTAYYRSLGFFKARIGRTLDFSDSGKWLTLTFVIDEGPRYKIRNVSVIGNQAFDTDAILESRLHSCRHSS